MVTFTEEILNGKLYSLYGVCFISFIIFVLKTTSMYFDTFIHVSSVTEFSKEALVQFITNTIVTELVLADLQ